MPSNGTNITIRVEGIRRYRAQIFSDKEFRVIDEVGEASTKNSLLHTCPHIEHCFSPPPGRRELLALNGTVALRAGYRVFG